MAIYKIEDDISEIDILKRLQEHSEKMVLSEMFLTRALLSDVLGAGADKDIVDTTTSEVVDQAELVIAYINEIRGRHGLG